MARARAERQQGRQRFASVAEYRVAVAARIETVLEQLDQRRVVFDYEDLRHLRGAEVGAEGHAQAVDEPGRGGRPIVAPPPPPPPPPGTHCGAPFSSPAPPAPAPAPRGGGGAPRPLCSPRRTPPGG